MLIASYGKMSGFMNEGRAADTFHLKGSKAFDTVSHSVAIFKLGCCSLDGWAARWANSCCDGQAESVVVNG